jgi:hypothetical protein
MNLWFLQNEQFVGWIKKFGGFEPLGDFQTERWKGKYAMKGSRRIILMIHMSTWWQYIQKHFKLKRSLFLKIMASFVEYYAYFKQKKVDLRFHGLWNIQKCITNAYIWGIYWCMTNEYVKLGDITWLWNPWNNLLSPSIIIFKMSTHEPTVVDM